ncbi:UDP-N-acetylmuramoyl-tripeptide--D-alanyl-D-alanine ligase [Schaalia georgiae F0490]|uniref:UDP-N-acetylmuramoyl-tripeptide--D-alanyl-D-alanine ligase n=1 Tax=Schaalia georgiae F0490 TaxID=1125717 RepID=J1HLT7_9ACTO|nr:UDP-N-acetylmuramoyl-tripeptide--D-alanyl-D-alanine ligase [Schaalia georgiae]EJF46533.1 UDP-N-acetylmuramoyl-tripeptide--D-alanyl-D-alanine ligase [Schaalia georgiae F0490]
MQRSATWIAEATRGVVHGPDVSANGPVVTDSREAAPGGVYVARRGENADGHDYVASAARAGAVCALVERVVDLSDCPPITQVVVGDATQALGDLARAHLEALRAAGAIDVVAVTGSVGKTTTKDLLLQVLSADAPTVAPRLSFNNEVGLPLTVLSADESTRHLVLEMGASGPGHIAYLTRIAPPDVAIELIVGHAHMGGFGSVAGVAEAKAELIDGSRQGATAVLNADDPNVTAMAPRAKGPVVRFSPSGADADVVAEDVRVDAAGRASFTLAAPEGREPVSLSLVGAHHVANALAAATGACALGLGLPLIACALSGAQALSPHRMDVRDLRIGAVPLTLIDDAYNANIDSMRAAVAALESIGRGRRTIAVLSEMLELGEDSPATHRAVGAMLSDARVGTLIGLGRDAHYYSEGAAAVPDRVLVEDPGAALAAVLNRLTDDCVVLVKGSYNSYSWKVADGLLEEATAR